jgi:HAD superfamily hydrolase (TIGR01509 family)
VSIKAITIDFWGTLLFDPPSSDNRYKGRRMKDFENILGAAGFKATVPTLERAYDASGAYLGRVWQANRDVSAADHVTAILRLADPELPNRVPGDVLEALVDAYARPILLVPPAVDVGAGEALRALRAQGYVLAVVSNTMRTPGTTLRKLLERFGLMECFAHATFSDEVLVRKPDPQIFALTLRALGSDPSESVHVGDDGVLDVEGARAAGMRAIQVTSASLKALGARRPDAAIASLAALPAAIAELEG